MEKNCTEGSTYNTRVTIRGTRFTPFPATNGICFFLYFVFFISLHFAGAHAKIIFYLKYANLSRPYGKYTSGRVQCVVQQRRVCCARLLRGSYILQVRNNNIVARAAAAAIDVEFFFLLRVSRLHANLFLYIFSIRVHFLTLRQEKKNRNL